MVHLVHRGRVDQRDDDVLIYPLCGGSSTVEGDHFTLRLDEVDVASYIKQLSTFHATLMILHAHIRHVKLAVKLAVLHSS